MADKNASFCVKMLHHHGLLTRTDVTSRFVGHSTHRDIGRADIFCSHRGRAVGVEVKYGTTSWRHHPRWDKKAQEWQSGWTFRQREWGVMSQEHPFCTPYYVFLTMGEHSPQWNPEKYNPRKSWLVPYRAMFDAVNSIETICLIDLFA